mmetsp:Transcript_51691/g.167948  ORF Transcript_51691/g.167948 Transcript_51691/m.167948 type:complete len:203 (+) Transcript_51691:864-1472(+)
MWPLEAATLHGVAPPLAARPPSARRASSAWTTAPWPEAAARKAAVWPYSFAASTGAPSSSASSTPSSAPLSAAAANRCTNFALVAPASSACTKSRQGRRPSSTARSAIRRRIAAAAAPSRCKVSRQSPAEYPNSTPSRHTLSAGAVTVSTAGPAASKQRVRYSRPSVPRTTATSAPTMRRSCCGPKSAAEKLTVDQSDSTQR